MCLRILCDKDGKQPKIIKLSRESVPLTAEGIRYSCKKMKNAVENGLSTEL